MVFSGRLCPHSQICSFTGRHNSENRASRPRSRSSFRRLSGGATDWLLARATPTLLRQAVDIGASERVCRVCIQVDPPLQPRWVRLQVTAQLRAEIAKAVVVEAGFGIVIMT